MSASKSSNRSKAKSNDYVSQIVLPFFFLHYDNLRRSERFLVHNPVISALLCRIQGKQLSSSPLHKEGKSQIYAVCLTCVEVCCNHVNAEKN